MRTQRVGPSGGGRGREGEAAGEGGSGGGGGGGRGGSATRSHGEEKYHIKEQEGI